MKSWHVSSGRTGKRRRGLDNGVVVEAEEEVEGVAKVDVEDPVGVQAEDTPAVGCLFEKKKK